MFKKIIFASTLLLSSSFTFAENASQKIEINAPVIDSQLSKNGSTEVFMQLKNNASINYELIAATSPAAAKIQLREPDKNPNQYKIIRSITLSRNSEKDLQLGSTHIVLIDLKKSLMPGEAVPITLIFSDGSWTTINATVN